MITRFFYSVPFIFVFLETATMYAAWTAVMPAARERSRRIIAAAGTALAFLLVFGFTLFGRSHAVAHDVSLTPLISFAVAREDPMFYRTMYLNVLLFVPLGLSLPYLLPGTAARRVLLTVAAGFLLSVGVEATQFLLQIGRCETDDVIMNTLGVTIGATSYLFYRLYLKRKKQ